MWEFRQPGGQREINELHVPVGKAVVVSLAAQDVIHSFYVPAFRIKQDAVPGRTTHIWFIATQPGRYHLFCAQYCGTQHSEMGGWVIAMAPEQYAAWLNSQGARARRSPRAARNSFAPWAVPAATARAAR
ncbi:cupredoxin domain-containing protein [Mesorhizobium atlanticum]